MRRPKIARPAHLVGLNVGDPQRTIYIVPRELPVPLSPAGEPEPSPEPTAPITPSPAEAPAP